MSFTSCEDCGQVRHPEDALYLQEQSNTKNFIIKIIQNQVSNLDSVLDTEKTLSNITTLIKSLELIR